jgi:ribonuclease HIII
MNDLLNDINILKQIKTSIGVLHADALKNYIQHHINEKQKIVDDFEKQAPQDIQDLCLMIRGGK